MGHEEGADQGPLDRHAQGAHLRHPKELIKDRIKEVAFDPPWGKLAATDPIVSRTRSGHQPGVSPVSPASSGACRSRSTPPHQAPAAAEPPEQLEAAAADLDARLAALADQLAQVEAARQQLQAQYDETAGLLKGAMEAHDTGDRRMILVISYPEDPHAARVIGLLAEGQHEVLLLTLSDLPARATLTIDYDDPAAPGPRVSARRADRSTSAPCARSGGGVRRSPDPSSVTDLDARMFTANEWNEALNGLWQLIGAPWMNPPARDEVAGRKAHQLRVAAEVGPARAADADHLRSRPGARRSSRRRGWAARSSRPSPPRTRCGARRGSCTRASSTTSTRCASPR